MKRLPIIVVLLLLAALSSAGAETVSRIAAVVNDEIITTFRLDREVTERLTAQARGRQLSAEEMDALRRKVLSELIDETLIRLSDTDYCFRIQLAGVKLHLVPEAVIHVRYRDTFPGMFNQARLWAKYNALLAKRYRPSGMRWETGRHWYRYLGACCRLVWRLPRIRHRGDRRPLAGGPLERRAGDPFGSRSPRYSTIIVGHRTGALHPLRLCGPRCADAAPACFPSCPPGPKAVLLTRLLRRSPICCPASNGP